MKQDFSGKMFGVDNICHRMWTGKTEVKGGQIFRKAFKEKVSFRQALEDENYLNRAEGGRHLKQGKMKRVQFWEEHSLTAEEV